MRNFKLYELYGWFLMARKKKSRWPWNKNKLEWFECHNLTYFP